MKSDTIDKKITIQNKTVNTWTERASKLLKGKKVSEVRYLTTKECEDQYWTARGIVIHLTDEDGSNEILIYPSRDDEGNDCGALFTTDDDLPIIPVIPHW